MFNLKLGDMTRALIWSDPLGGGLWLMYYWSRQDRRNRAGLDTEGQTRSRSHGLGSRAGLWTVKLVRDISASTRA